MYHKWIDKIAFSKAHTELSVQLHIKYITIYIIKLLMIYIITFKKSLQDNGTRTDAVLHLKTF